MKFVTTMTEKHLTTELQKLIPGSIAYGNFWIYRHKSNISNHFVNKPGKLPAMAIILCSKGQITLNCNFRQFEVNENMVFIAQPHSTLNVKVSEDCEGYVIATEASSLTDYIIDPRHIPELLEKAYESSLIKLENTECAKICKAIDMLCGYITNNSESPFKSAIIQAGMNTFAYIFAEILYMHMPQIEYELRSMNREKEHFNRFIKILSENYTKEREVGYYADRMNLTPRYLTTTIRKVSGHTVSDWISRFVMKDAKYLLKHSDMTVQQISYELNFPNQSFFGKYFKKHTGMSPGTFRQRCSEDAL